MKTIYIPKGETVSYENLVTGRIVVHGCLKVLDGIKAKSITGSGVIYAGSVSADDIRVDDLESASVTCRRLIAKRVQTPQLIASESAAVSCYLASSYVETGKLTVAASEVCEIKADEIIHLTPKRRSLFRLLLVSALHSLWMKLTSPAVPDEPVDAEWKPAASELEKAPEKPAEGSLKSKDQELDRMIAMFNLPAFDFAHGKAA